MGGLPCLQIGGGEAKLTYGREFSSVGVGDKPSSLEGATQSGAILRGNRILCHINSRYPLQGGTKNSPGLIFLGKISDEILVHIFTSLFKDSVEFFDICKAYLRPQFFTALRAGRKKQCFSLAFIF